MQFYMHQLSFKTGKEERMGVKPAHSQNAPLPQRPIPKIAKFSVNMSEMIGYLPSFGLLNKGFCFHSYSEWQNTIHGKGGVGEGKRSKLQETNSYYRIVPVGSFLGSKERTKSFFSPPYGSPL